MTPDEYLSLRRMLIACIDSLINLTRNITRTKEFFMKSQSLDIKSQYIKIAEENMEAFSEYEANSSCQAEEDIDILMSVMTLFHGKNYSGQELDAGIDRVLKKFIERKWITIEK